MTQTPPPASAAFSFSIPTGREIYDALMSAIDMELVTDNIPHLDEKYEGESSEERKKRYQRYQQSYEKYDAAFKGWIGSLRGAVDAYRHDALRSAEAVSAEEEAKELSQLETQMHST